MKMFVAYNGHKIETFIFKTKKIAKNSAYQSTEPLQTIKKQSEREINILKQYAEGYECK